MTEDEREQWETTMEERARELWLRLWDNLRETGLDGFAPGVDGPRNVVEDFLLFCCGEGSQLERSRTVDDACEGHNGSPRDIRPAGYFGPALTWVCKCGTENLVRQHPTCRACDASY